MKDDKVISQSHNQIFRHLEELGNFKAEWDKFESDGCYCHDDGNIE